MNLHVCAILNCNMQTRSRLPWRAQSCLVVPGATIKTQLFPSGASLPWVMALPFHCHSLSFKYLRRSHSRFGTGEVCFAVGQPEPHVSLNMILRNAETLHIEQTQIVPALPRSSQVGDMLRSLTVPFGG